MFEIGDKVIYQGADKAAYKREGTVKSIEDKDGKPQLTVELDGGETFTAPIDDWSRKFANSARNAKFKVGDKIYAIPGKIEGVGGYGEIYALGKYNDYHVKIDGRPYLVPEWVLRLANSCTSTNSVVRNAMAARRVARNACARNAAIVTISVGYAARVQHAMRDLARAYGARISGTNTIACSDEDEAEEIVEMLVKEYKVPKDEVWINSRRVAKNADYTDATNRLRFCLDSLYKADDYRNEAVRIVAQLINEGVIDKSAASKMNEMQRLLAQAIAVGKDLYYNRIRP